MGKRLADGIGDGGQLNWYWVVDEIKAGGGQPQLVNARLGKLMMGSVNKSDRLDEQGLNRLQRTGSLPTV